MSVDSPPDIGDKINQDEEDSYSTEDSVESRDELLAFIRKRHEETQSELASEQSINDLHDEISDLRKENERLNNKLDSIQGTVPLPAYFSLLLGAGLLGFVFITGFDPIIFVGSVGIICISISALYESKIRMNRL
jgi:hypothetical protein